MEHNCVDNFVQYDFDIEENGDRLTLTRIGRCAVCDKKMRITDFYNWDPDDTIVQEAR